MIKVLIFGGSGYLGNTIYKELNPFYDVYGTYYKKRNFKKYHKGTPKKVTGKNKKRRLSTSKSTRKS
mgnify:CR=1 FL=1